ncbi:MULTISPECIES: MerR family transcriptional regulator [Bacillus]|uniref:Transcriptional activator of adhA-yraA and yraC n=1 Tax=Bacillus amyloliquefaciens (strain ATCC 23350 / DSM 7 / BCRC 11601 / CCUG 28519 / NBRC 15535 / NRRL B-14393 / F) TaxID=692420 RepID=A0A9P1JF96_BACAS|nr:MerR family transcriptional regulator [Bacillus amyloliquefaciens]AIW32582.1 transcriptional regulator [Bacillus subtilis]AEB22684.1 transcriptional activator of adhA-yraA and yraC [Bacillus amyloliquefaciens TA208]AEB62060.1 transcriptional activator of adhA-yraA and yraC [Bacillus amyloliquefaciens LL3]AEK87667.1 putative transcriptional regulator (MerR family) [Bacillus amyloliquefaciens XH7]ARW37689.1 HTH-type transcriptional regulator AdhR [Bacillus amyloliquefaciens]
MKIAQAAKQVELSTATLRYYESIGLIPPVKRNGSGIRDYDENDVNWIQFIKCMRSAGLSIEALIEYTALFTEGADHTIEPRKNILINERKRLKEKQREIGETINRLNKKIEDYEDILENEAKLKGSLKAECISE